MALINDNDKIVHYYFDVKDFYFTINKQKQKMQDYQLKSFTVINDYAANLFPIIRIVVAMDAKMYYQIIKSKSNVRVKLRVQKYTREPAKKTRSINQNYIDETFDLILDDDDEDMYEKLRETNHREGLKDDELFEQANEVEFFLFKSKMVKMSKKRINKIIKQGTVTDVIALIATKIGLNNLLMSRASNDKEYKPLIIPPLKATDAIRYIDTYYGIYNVGMLFFFGIERTYLLRYEAACTAYEPKEIQNTRIMVPMAGSVASQHLCSVLKAGDSNSYYVIGNYESIQFENRSITGKITKAENIHVQHTASPDASEDPGKETNKTIIINRGESKYLGSIYKRRLASLDTVITVEFRDVDLEAFMPNKRFSFIFEDKKLHLKYSGHYLLLYAELGLVREASDMTSVAKCVFYRT